MLSRLRLALRLFASVHELRVVVSDISAAYETLRIANLDLRDPRIDEALGFLTRPRLFFRRTLGK